MGTKMAAKCVEWMFDQLKLFTRADGSVFADTADSAVLLGVKRRAYTLTPLSELKKETNFESRIPTQQWWLKLRPLLRILAKHESTYEEEGMYMHVEEQDEDHDPLVV
ncbi:hypothetical protein LSTR_LSTR011927 [Laodelphax striatellus]|uniref:Uncharacterized protein n=1 Tax=Laodelphax striatellus TaxID=195883 RepID=A0A482WXV8_LAOST|nr:hypothetical protein LSTR_LSTR011927 [Laodelphax striatellus]